MAINDISMLAVSEQDSYLVKKDSDKTKLDSSNDAGFFDQLALANQASETHSTQAKAPNKQSADEQSDLNEQSSEEKPLSGEDMLAQINAAQVIDTSVKNNPHGGAQLIDKDAVKINAKPEDKLAPIITMPSDAVVDDEIIPQTQNVQGANLAGKGEGEPTLLDTKALAAVNASQKGDVVSSQLATDKVADKPTDTTTVKSSLDSSILALLSKDDNAIKADKLLANLTPAQQGELATELNAMSKPINKDNLADLKQLLSKYVSESEKPQTPQQTINAQISTLTTSEKQALLNQLQGYIKNESLPTKELASLKGVISDLETAINADSLFSAKDKPLFSNNALAGAIAPKAQTGTESANVKPELKLESSKSVADNPEELAKQLDALQKESMRGTNAEQMPPRAAQIFSQIINVFDKQSLNTLAKYDTLGYEQAIIEAQSLQAGQLQSTAQAKQVSIDPATLQALNIIKSDAAKMLQERVSSMLSINNKEAEIRLDPPEMGSMQIRIRSDAEQAQINFVVQNQQAKEALEQSLPRLREMLMQQGLELGESSISYGDSSGEQAQQQEGDAQGQMANNRSTDETNSEQPDKQIQGSGQQTSSSIDYYA
ncbi:MULTISPECIES: flagellar hook-length control protein FliK [Pseudoalteromonas]|uniref:flagellar hook-length control protein FliK n=1 Tax=Pseudoalteromonas TaxID=53246 RepID=UPI0002DA6CEF|nr:MULTISPECIES: flagellar hook-length control protein FliK [Pseudoalteromonas]MDN3404649.1 flagellar hook-length control protein FliK [Pseudoalteromonas sp. APC 3218]MDN3408445.1 flagellar hook-length control protein FliK [Pseudoalteromonas sp. APC 3894]MDN3415122.1 flagellar hook-length control protein FliK [Pseudoalteromonas sp. APC 3227]MDN3418820.1 flagellar hook-length control protein FliK [Pseudoalteromonas sp. APC 3895]MDN3423152.1 flagellar hook-length control protein FliK [Pseudoalte|tara:strand:+ start:51532 stop:53340 length:1809 start_codon:yes stop_codon:yes gene_type:complete